jgi:ribose 1,5-bisphosphokinase PhnN
MKSTSWSYESIYQNAGEAIILVGPSSTDGDSVQDRLKHFEQCRATLHEQRYLMTEGSINKSEGQNSQKMKTFCHNNKTRR